MPDAPITCYGCGQQGHMKRECPLRGNGGTHQYGMRKRRLPTKGGQPQLLRPDHCSALEEGGTSPPCLRTEAACLATNA
ncbi:MAG: hypothetical protein GY696_33055 [Gammaproteobacteria bacterium]|nr:hypothetical protein [Gammaproteobacteria bacterium]